MGEYGSGRVELRASAYDRAARDEEEAAINAVRSQFRRQGSTTSRSVVAAAVAISDAVSGVERLQPLVRGQSQRAFRLQLALDGAAQSCVLVLLALTFFEIPRWCSENGQCVCVYDVDDPAACPYPTFDIRYVNEYAAVLIQVMCAGVVVAHLSCNLVAVGVDRFFSRQGQGWVGVVTLLSPMQSAMVISPRAPQPPSWSPSSTCLSPS